VEQFRIRFLHVNRHRRDNAGATALSAPVSVSISVPMVVTPLLSITASGANIFFRGNKHSDRCSRRIGVA